MKRQAHLSENVLKRLLDEDREVPEQHQIETHIAECKQCRTRLMAIAADDAWRNEFDDCLSGQILPDALGQNSLTTSGELASDKSDASGVLDYDQASINMLMHSILLPPTHPETLGRLGRYEVESMIGCGGMGVVFKGYDRELQRPAAIKLVLPRLVKNGTAKQRFSREARAAAAVLHPNVISIHEINETKGVPWIAMPYIPGPSLKELVDEQGPLPEKEIVRIGRQIASGLAAAHGQGLVHRDIKPENILVDNRVNRVVITDFGLARRESEEPMTKTGVLAGTLNYMSPEQTKGKPLDGKSDLFSLGSLLYYLATGVVPFRSESAVGVMHNISNERHTDVRELNPDISLTLANVIDRLLEKETANRFQSAARLEGLLEEHIAHLNRPSHHVAPKVPRLKRSRPDSKLKMMAAALLLVFAGALGSAAWFNRPTAPKELSADAFWGEIKANYEIGLPKEFDNELQRFGREVSRLDDAIGRTDSMETERFWQELHELEQAMESPEIIRGE